jgi:hypothetical protein
MPAEPEKPTMDDRDVPIVVELDAGREPADRVLAALDAALASDAREVVVELRLSDGNPDRATIAELCSADERVSVLEPGAPEPAPPPASIRIAMPLSARPSVHTLTAIRERMAADGVGKLEVPLPGSGIGRLARAVVPLGPRLRASGPGSGSGRVRASAVALGSRRAPSEAPSPKGSLAHERAEHLRHRARSATLRAQRDRHTQRLARERTEVEHQRARVRMLERRLAATGPGAWVAWRARQAARVAAAVPRRVVRLAKTARWLVRRARRLTIDRARRRLSPRPEVPKAGTDDGR